MSEKTKLIVITGKQGSGKTTLAEALKAAYKKTGSSTTIKFADPIYNIQKIVYDFVNYYYGLPKLAKDEKDRPLLQFLGTDWAQARFGPTVWADVWKQNVQQIVIGMAVTDDLRFPHELAVAKEVGATLIRLTCPETVRAERIGKNFSGTKHPSETALDSIHDVEFDFVFDTSKETTQQIVQALIEQGRVFDETT